MLSLLCAISLGCLLSFGFVGCGLRFRSNGIERDRLMIYICVCLYTGHLRRLLLLRVYAAGKRQGWLPEDYQPRQLEDGSLLPEEEFPEPLKCDWIFIHIAVNREGKGETRDERINRNVMERGRSSACGLRSLDWIRAKGPWTFHGYSFMPSWTMNSVSRTAEDRRRREIYIRAQ